jgi:mannosyltransferase OCH1-like enzyme
VPLELTTDCAPPVLAQPPAGAQPANRTLSLSSAPNHKAPSCRRSRFLAARIIKILGNCLKAPCYLLYLLFPKKRFLIPHHAQPLWSSSRPTAIPRTVWQTNFTDQVTLPLFLNYLFNRLISPTYEFRLMGDQAADAFIQTHYPGRIWNLYSKLQIGAARADFWRLLVLQTYGGVYLDIDAHVVWPLESILGPQTEELYLQHKQGQLTNYFLASKSHNPNIARLIEAIADNLEHASSNDVYELTGPAVLNRCLKGLAVPANDYKLTSYQGTFTNEFFHYVDRPESKWYKAQRTIRALKD